MTRTLIALPLFAMIGCANELEFDYSGLDADVDTMSTGADWDSRIRVMHLSPDAPAVDVFVNGDSNPAVTGLEFEEGTGYLMVPPGSYTFDVAPSGSPIEDSVLNFAIDLRAGFSYTAAATDYVSSITPLGLLDVRRGTPMRQARVKVAHTAPGVGDVDIWLLDGTPTKLLDNVPFGASAALNVPLSPTGYSIGFDVDEDGVPDVDFSVPRLTPGSFTNLFAANDTMGNVFLLAQLDSGDIARIDAN